jgi:hypothetical protein
MELTNTSIFLIEDCEQHVDLITMAVRGAALEPGIEIDRAASFDEVFSLDENGNNLLDRIVIQIERGGKAVLFLDQRLDPSMNGMADFQDAIMTDAEMIYCAISERCKSVPLLLEKLITIGHSVEPFVSNVIIHNDPRSKRIYNPGLPIFVEALKGRYTPPMLKDLINRLMEITN